MSAFILFTAGIFLFLIIMYLLVKRSGKKSIRKRGDSIAKKMETLKEEEKKSHLGKRLFYKIKSGLFKR